jgi:hypothetical protein
MGCPWSGERSVSVSMRGAMSCHQSGLERIKKQLIVVVRIFHKEEIESLEF